jgi:predicted Zn finger-like uncharacterized protein
VIARCPECQAGYRIAPEKIGPRGARIQCARCQQVFRVDPPAADAAQEGAPAAPAAATRPAAPAPRPAARASAGAPSLLVAEADAAAGKALAGLLERRGYAVELVANGAEALLQIHRRKPACAILGGRLPGISAPALCEVVRRTAELSGVRLIRVAPLDEPVGAPEFEANHTLEPGDLPEGVARLLEKLGLVGVPAAAAAGAPAAKPAAAPAKPAVAPAKPGAAPAKPAAAGGDGDHVAAERLARIIISDIILYNEEKFHAALRDGTIATALETELREAGQMFAQRVPEALRAKRDFLHEELMRRANKLMGGC